MKWMLLPLRRYADFSGRSRRKEYWSFVLLNFLMSFAVLFALGATYAAGMGESEMTAVLMPLFALYGLASLAFIIPGIAVTVRRLHDTDRSGWAILYGFIPIIGLFMLLAFYLTEGTRGPNRFGPDPKAEAVGAAITPGAAATA